MRVGGGRQELAGLLDEAARPREVPGRGFDAAKAREADAFVVDVAVRARHCQRALVRRARAVVLPHLPVEEPQRRERDGLPAPGPRPTRQHERSPVLRARLE